MNYLPQIYFHFGCEGVFLLIISSMLPIETKHKNKHIFLKRHSKKIPELYRWDG